jgi:transposase
MNFWRSQESIVFHYIPKHASWMNQIEIWFRILMKKVIKQGSSSMTIKHALRLWVRKNCGVEIVRQLPTTCAHAADENLWRGSCS